MYSAWLCHGIEINITCTCFWWFSLHCCLVSDIDCMCLGIQINIKYVNVFDNLVCICSLVSDIDCVGAGGWHQPDHWFLLLRTFLCDIL